MIFPRNKGSTDGITRSREFLFQLMGNLLRNKPHLTIGAEEPLEAAILIFPMFNSVDSGPDIYRRNGQKTALWMQFMGREQSSRET